MTRIRMAHPETRDFLTGLGHFEEVDIHDYKAAQSPLASFNYHYCIGLTVCSGDLYGLCHAPPGDDAEPYIDGLRHEIGAGSNGKMQAIIVANQDCPFSYNFITGCENSRELRIVGIYLGWGEEQKDAVVVPSLREVLVFTGKGRPEIRKFS